MLFYAVVFHTPHLSPTTSGKTKHQSVKDASATKWAMQEERAKKATEMKARKLAECQEQNQATVDNCTIKNNSKIVSNSNLAAMLADAMQLQERMLKQKEVLAQLCHDKAVWDDATIVEHKDKNAKIVTNHELAAMKAAQEETNEANKCKESNMPGAEFFGARVCCPFMKDQMMSSPLKKKLKGTESEDSDSERYTSVDPKDVNNEEVKVVGVLPPPVADTSDQPEIQEPAQDDDSLIDMVTPCSKPPVAPPKDSPSILKKTMLQAGKEGTEDGIKDFFKARAPGYNWERIPKPDFVNMWFLKMTFTILVKPKDVPSLMGTKHAWDFIIDWFYLTQADIGKHVTLILLMYIMTNSNEPEAICDVKKYLPLPLAKLKKYINNFHVNNKSSTNGKEYQMYTKVHIGTNAFGKDFTQLVEDLKDVHPGVTVYVSTLQRPNPAQVNWIMDLHCSFNLVWFTGWTNNLLVQLHVGTCWHTLPDLDKALFIDRDLIVVAFTWHTIYNGYTKEQCAKNAKTQAQAYAAQLVIQKEDKTLARAFMVSLLLSPVLRQILSLEFHLVPTFQNDNGPTECNKL